MRTFSTVNFIIIISLFLATSLFGQGAIQGVVSDSASSEALFGANLSILETSLGASTDLYGKYRISNIPAGTYKLRVSYIGYKSKTIEVKIESKNISLNIDLLPEAIRGKEIVVTAQAQGQTAAINQQLSSNTIVNVVSEQKIQALPDANAAESLGRLPGIAVVRSGGEANQIVLRGLSPQFSTITLDGVKIASTNPDDRGVDLSTIAQGTLAGIELYKALTSDKDADAIAGSVNLITKKAPSERLLWLDSKGAYNKLDNSLKQYDFNLRYGERFFNDIVGVQLTGNLEQRVRSNESDSLTYDQTTINNGKDYQITDFQLNYQNEIRKRNGFGILLDFNTPDSGSIKIHSVYNKTSRNYLDYGRNYPSFSTNSVTYNARDVQQDINTYNGFINGDNYFLGLTANWGLSFAQSESETPYDYEVEFQEPSSTDSTGKPISGMEPIPASLHHGPPEAIMKYALNNYNFAYLYDAYDRYQKNFTKENTAFLNLSKKYALSSFLSGEAKAGGKYRSTVRIKNATEFLAPYYLIPLPSYEKTSNGTVVRKSFSGTRFANLSTIGNSILVTNFLDAVPQSRSIYNLYNLNPLLNRDAIEAWRSLNINGVTNSDGSGPEYARNNAIDGDYYDVNEKVSAGYLMNTLNIGSQITFIAGVRVESENNNYNSRYSPSTLSGFPTPAGLLRDTASSHKETIWLPNFQLLLKMSDFMNIRLAAYRALARPDFNRRLANYVTRAAGTFYTDNSLEVGNPGLRDAKAWNYEVNTSFFGNYIGLFSVSVYYKDITDMFHTINGISVAYEDGQRVLDSLGIGLANPFSSDFQLKYQSNSSKPTKVWGVEVEHQINFWFLPSFLSGFVLSYNFSFVRSETYIPISAYQTYYVQIGPIKLQKTKPEIADVKQNLEGSPDFIGNVSLGYDIEGFSARLSLFHQSQSNSTFSFDGRNDIAINAFTRLDLALKQKINDHIAILVNLNNLTNVEEGTSIVNRVTGWTLLRNSQKYGLTADLGVRFTL